MPDIKQFRLPDVGEGLTEADIVGWKVRPGDTVTVNQTIVEIETAKSLVELPCPFAGRVDALLVEEGTTVEVGTPIIAVDTAPGGSAAAAADTPDGGASEEAVPEPPEEGAVEPGMIGGAAAGGRTSVLVGYGPRTTEAKRRPRRGQVAATVPASHPDAPAPLPEPIRESATDQGRRERDGVAEDTDARPGDAQPGDAHAPGARRSRAGTVLAKPPVRRLAKELGVDLSDCTPTGPGGVVTRDDVLALADGAAAGKPEPPAEGVATPAPGERETRIPIKGVRRATAQAMVASAFTAPHVTEFVTVDVTRTMRLLDRLRADREFEGVRVSPLLAAARALLLAVRRNPGINAAWDDDRQEVVVKHYVNLGIAAATPRGLVVPNIKDAHTLTLRGLADALSALTATAREGRTPPADMAGGTISITNVGVFGVDTGTPILNPGEAAILCLGAVRDMPWVHKGRVRSRKVTQLALSFDHRLVDGDLGSRVLADVAAVLERPDRALAWG